MADPIKVPRKNPRVIERAGNLSLLDTGEVEAGYRNRFATRGRKTQDGHGRTFGGARVVVAPEDHLTDWQLYELDRQTLRTVTPSKLVEYLVDISPAFSRAVWDFLRLCDAGHDIKVYKPGTKEVFEEANEALMGFYGVLKGHYGSMKLITNRLFMSGYLRGAMFAELVLDADQQPIDLVVPDPMSVRFRPIEDPVRGQRYELGQWQNHDWVSLEIPTVRYFPVDPWPGKPYGRAPASPAIFPTLFLLGLMHDLRRVVAQQGYPRIDIAVSLENLKNAYPNVHKKGGEAWDQLIDDALTTVVNVYAELEPEDAFVHTDDSTVNRPVGALDSQAIQASDTLIKALERMAVQAVKTMPLMLGITDGVSEANANRQWEIMAAGVKSFQHATETVMSDLAETALEAMGFLADVKFTFAELRASELQRDEQTVQLRSQNAAFMEDRGWMTPIEAAAYGLARDPSPEVLDALKDRPITDPTEPVEPPASAAEPIPADVDPDPGETKSIRLDVPGLLDDVRAAFGHGPDRRDGDGRSIPEPVAIDADAGLRDPQGDRLPLGDGGRQSDADGETVVLDGGVADADPERE